MSAAMSEMMVRFGTIPEALAYWSQKTPDAPFTLCGLEWETYASLESKSHKLACALSALGLAKGDRVAVILPNCPEIVVSMFALFRSGIIYVPLNTYLRGDFLRYQLHDSGAKAVICDEPGAVELSKLSELTGIEHIILAGDFPHPLRSNCTVHRFEDLVADGQDRANQSDIRSGDLAAILYTSGTTGMPKGCMVGHGYCVTRAQHWYRAGWLTAGDRLLSPMPLFHGGAVLCCLLPTLQFGLSACFDASFSARQFIARANAVEATYGWLPGPMGMGMLKTDASPSDRDHMLKRMVLSPFLPVFQKRFEERFGIPVLTRVFGQTEVVPASVGPWGSSDESRATAGHAVSDIEIRILDEDDEPLGAGIVGEIAVRPRGAHGMFQGYWNKPEETLKTFKNLWHHTGDLGTMTADGELRFVDRKKDAIRRRGENVSAFELERTLLTHDAVQTAAAHSVPSELGEDEIKVCLVLNEGCSITPQELFDFLRARVPYFAIPRFVELMQSFPVNAMGRVMKADLRQRGIGSAWDLEKLGLVVDKSERRG